MVTEDFKVHRFATPSTSQLSPKPFQGEPACEDALRNSKMLPFRFQEKLDSGGIGEAVRYETQGLTPCLVQTVLLRLALRVHRHGVLSNSYLLHELAEATAFRAKGFDFSSKAILLLSSKQRVMLQDLKREMYYKDRGPHLAGVKEQHEYLHAVALSQGYSTSPGAILRMSPIMPKREVAETFAQNVFAASHASEHYIAYNFFRQVLEEEPQWHSFLREVHSRCPIHFFEYSANAGEGEANERF